MPDSQRIRALLIAEAANPEWVSVPLVGWSHAQALARRVDAHLVTQIRNRDAIVRAGLVEGRDFTAIDSEKVGGPLYRMARSLRGGKGKGWTTVMAFNAMAYYYFEHLVWQRFRDDLKAKRFDLVHRLTPLSPTVPSTLARRCRRAGVPFVLGPLNGGLPWPRAFDRARRREREWLSYVRSAYKLMPGYHATRKNAASILAASIATYEQISPRYHDKCFYVPENAIDPERFSHSRNREASRPLRAAFVGRLVPYKSADMLLEAAAPLLRAGDLTIEILGDGPELPALRALVDREGIAETVRLRGWVAHAEISAALAECDLFTFPSIREFGGGVVLEAMAVGLVPVIVDYGGPGELVTEQTGVKVPLGTRAEIIQRLRAALAELAADPARVDTLSRNAIRRIHRLFTWDAKAAQTVDIYQWVLGRKPKPNIPMPLPDPVDERPSPSLSRLA